MSRKDIVSYTVEGRYAGERERVSYIVGHFYLCRDIVSYIVGRFYLGRENSRYIISRFTFLTVGTTYRVVSSVPYSSGTRDLLGRQGVSGTGPFPFYRNPSLGSPLDAPCEPRVRDPH